MTYQTNFGDQFDREEFAAVLTSEILPSILRSEPRGRLREDFGASFAREGVEQEQKALLEATQRFAPPENLRGASDIHAILMGVVALRAASGETLANVADPRERYAIAAGWVCENFGAIIWWGCD